MNEKTTTPIGRMAELLAEMTERATEAERQRDAAREEADDWYRNYLRTKTQLEGTEAELTTKTKENEVLMETLGEYIEKLQKGAQENA